MQLKNIFIMKNELKNFKLKDLGYIEGSYLPGVKIKLVSYQNPKTNCECYGLVAEYYFLTINGTQVSISEETYNEITGQFEKPGYAFTKAAQICKLSKHAKFDIRPYNR